MHWIYNEHITLQTKLPWTSKIIKNNLNFAHMNKVAVKNYVNEFLASNMQSYGELQ